MFFEHLTGGGEVERGCRRAVGFGNSSPGSVVSVACRAGGIGHHPVPGIVGQSVVVLIGGRVAVVVVTKGGFAVAGEFVLAVLCTIGFGSIRSDGGLVADGVQAPVLQ